MAILVNNTARLIIIGGRLFIPRKPVAGIDLKELSQRYPEVRSMLKSGLLIEQTKKQAEKLEAEFVEATKPVEETPSKNLEGMGIDELKAYAEEHGIKLGRSNKKETILAAIRKTEG